MDEHGAEVRPVPHGASVVPAPRSSPRRQPPDEPQPQPSDQSWPRPSSRQKPPNQAQAKPPSHPMPGLDPEIDVLCDWPRRTALVIGDNPSVQGPAALHKFGFSTAVSDLGSAKNTAAALGSFTFLLLSADALNGDAAVPVVRELHTMSPSARLLVERPNGALDPEILLRALRAGVVDMVDVLHGALEQAIASGLRRAGTLRERVLAIGAHPDDVEIGCAGTLLDHRLRGDRISVLTLSRGASGGDAEARVDEAVASSRAIGAQLMFGNLPDSRIEEGISTIRLIESVVKAVDPTVIYVHSVHDSHQDHRAVATATASATRAVRRVFAFQSPSATNDFRPTQFVPIDDVLQRKVQVLRMFTSQKDRDYLDPELIVAGSKYWARHLGADARYAEPFEVIRSIGDLRHRVSVPASASDQQFGFAIPSYHTGPGSPGSDR